MQSGPVAAKEIRRLSWSCGPASTASHPVLADRHADVFIRRVFAGEILYRPTLQSASMERRGARSPTLRLARTVGSSRLTLTDAPKTPFPDGD